MIKTLFDAHHADERLHQEYIDAGFGGSGERVNAKTFEPNEDYPLPWHYTRSPEGICTIYAHGFKQVASWLPEHQAKPIVDEANENYDPTPYCHVCGAMTRERCHCGPIADNE